MTDIAAKPLQALIERVNGPHEWGYRDVTDGTFIADDAPFHLASAAISSWQPIETAPMDGTRVLLFRRGHIVCGRWYDDRYAAKPRPYWSHDSERLWGTLDARKTQPTHWMPLPAPPEPAP